MTRFVLQAFRCKPLGASLTREVCGVRHSRRVQGIGAAGVRDTLAERSTCARCELGAAHDRGESPPQWPDGAEVELVELPLRARNVQPTASAVEEAPSGAEEVESMEPGSQTLTGGEAEAEDAPKPAPELDEAVAAEDLGEQLEGPPLRIRWAGRTMTVGEWAKDPACAPSENTLRMRLYSGWPPADALQVPTGSPRPERSGGKLKPQATPAEADLEAFRAWARAKAGSTPISGEITDRALRALVDRLHEADARRVVELEVANADNLVAYNTRVAKCEDLEATVAMRGEAVEALEADCADLRRAEQAADAEIDRLRAEVEALRRGRPVDLAPVRVVRPPAMAPASAPDVRLRLPLVGEQWVEVRSSAPLGAKHWDRLGRFVELQLLVELEAAGE